MHTQTKSCDSLQYQTKFTDNKPMPIWKLLSYLSKFKDGDVISCHMLLEMGPFYWVELHRLHKKGQMALINKQNNIIQFQMNLHLDLTRLISYGLSICEICFNEILLRQKRQGFSRNDQVCIQNWLWEDRVNTIEQTGI